jgi:phosphate:Na+ symporter
VNSKLEFGVMLVSVGGGLALFLYGMHKMTEALKIVAGERVKDLLSKLTTNRFSAAFAGATVTAVIQSSSITTVLVVGFITAGIMTFQQSIGVILGANVGTTITAQIIAFKITQSALLLIAVGFFTEILASKPRVKQFGAMSMGLGLLFFGMELMSQATEPLRGYEPFMQLMRDMANPLWGVLIGAVFTALVQSSSATTGIVIVMASQGLLSLETGIALILGSNIGTCVTAMISAFGKPREALQAATAHVLFNVIGVLLFVGFIPQYADLVRQFSPVSAGLSGLSQLAADTPRQIANAHTFFNVFNLVLFLGFTNALAKAVLRIVPSLPPELLPETTAKYLDDYYLHQPAMALERVRLELERIGNKVIAMIRDSLPTLTVGTRERIQSLQQRDDEIDSLTDAVALYLRQLTTMNLVDPQPMLVNQYFSAANYLENIADTIETGIAADSYKRLEHKLTISEETTEHLKDIYRELYLAAQLTLEALLENDQQKAQQVIDSKAHYNGLIELTRSHLFVRLKSEESRHLALYKIEASTIENYRRIHNLLRRVCKLIIVTEEPLQQQNAELPATEDNKKP